MMPTQPTPGSAAPETPDTPRAAPAHVIVRAQRLQLVLAGVLWAAAASVLGWRAFSWIAPEAWWPLLGAAGVAAGVVKARYLLDPVARRVTARIQTRGPCAPIVGFFSVQSWVAVVVMMAAGHTLRLTAIPRPILGVLYVAISTALLVSSRFYWTTHARGWGEIR